MFSLDKAHSETHNLLAPEPSLEEEEEAKKVQLWEFDSSFYCKHAITMETRRYSMGERVKEFENLTDYPESICQ